MTDPLVRFYSRARNPEVVIHTSICVVMVNHKLTVDGEWRAGWNSVPVLVLPAHCDKEPH